MLFIKQLDEVETTKENEANFLSVDYESIFPGECQKYRWSKFKNLGSAEKIKVATAGTNGQFRTPRHIIKMMVELVKPSPDDTIIEKAVA